MHPYRQIKSKRLIEHLFYLNTVLEREFVNLIILTLNKSKIVGQKKKLLKAWLNNQNKTQQIKDKKYQKLKKLKLKLIGK